MAIELPTAFIYFGAISAVLASHSSAAAPGQILLASLTGGAGAVLLVIGVTGLLAV
jgi:hypothetical protein